MNIFLTLAFLFFIGSLIGWVLEFFFRRFVSSGNKEKAWVNPGFLVGPYLPLYGSGLCILYLLAQIKLPFISNPVAQKLALFFVMAVAMTGIEYITGYIFIICMKVRLWDYTDNRGNIKGIICPLFSFFWAVLGALYYFLIHPHILSALDWLSRNLVFSFVIGFFYGVLVIDVSYSFNIVNKVRAFAKENELVVRYELLKEQIKESARQSKQKTRFFFPFNSDISFKEHLTRYIELKEIFDREPWYKAKIKNKKQPKS